MKIKPGMTVDKHVVQYTYTEDINKGVVAIRDFDGHWNYLLKCLDWKPLLDTDHWSSGFFRISDTWGDEDDILRTVNKGLWTYYQISDGTSPFRARIPGMYAYPSVYDIARVVVKGTKHPYYTFLFRKDGENIHQNFQLTYATIDEESGLIFMKDVQGDWHVRHAQSPDMYEKRDDKSIE